MTGTGMNIVTKNNIDSYNTAVNAINMHQKENIMKLERSLRNIKSSNDNFIFSISKLLNSVIGLKKQIFINQALIDNWNASGENYSFPTYILE